MIENIDTQFLDVLKLQMKLYMNENSSIMGMEIIMMLRPKHVFTLQ